MKVVKELRKQLKLKQTELADMLGIQKANYCNMENGRLVPKNIEEIENRAFDALESECEKQIISEESKLARLKQTLSAIHNKCPF